ncbi:hypothetical protein NHQ30_001278 [Ciborinia camelliae]|nr:hypothetical protein NHQ30_001278 [Ciborinia camelliae]
MATRTNVPSSNPPAPSSATGPDSPGTDTAFKKKYGPHPSRPQDRHSGLTPILPFISGTGVLKPKGTTLTREARQRLIYYDFTAKNLLDLDANITSSRSLKSSDLNVPIHPALNRGRWRPVSPRHNPHSLGTLGPGKWAAHNDRVWEIMEPSLQLATLMLNSIQPEFYDLILEGPRTPIDPNRFPENFPDWADQNTVRGLRSIQSRRLAPHDTALQKSKDLLLNRLPNIVVLGFREKSDILRYHGMTRYGQSKTRDGRSVPGATITLDQGNYKPLLYPNITAAEKLSYQWRNAVTITHECSHAMVRIAEYLKSLEDPSMTQDQRWKHWVRDAEPYFETHPVQECGFLMEQNALGGVTRGELNPVGSLFPTIAFFWTEWPSYYWVNYVTNIVLKTPPLPSKALFYPIPLKHFEDVHQMHFWNSTVKTFGTFMLGLRSVRLGMQLHERSTTASRYRTKEPALSGWKTVHAALKSKQNMNAEEQRACNAGDELIERARLNEKFFISNTKQEESLDHIIEYNETLKLRLQAIAAGSYYVGPGYRRSQVDPAVAVQEAMQTQLDMLMDVAHAHSAAVESYFALANSGEAPLESKTNLLLFNRGFRAFAREIACTSWSKEMKGDYEYIDEILEWKRQMLYNPDNSGDRQRFPEENGELLEIQYIMNVYKNIDSEPEEVKSDISSVSDSIEKRWVSSRYARASCMFFTLATQVVTGEAVVPEDTIDAMRKIIQVLESLRNGHENRPCSTWTNTLETMIRYAQKTVVDLRNKYIGASETEEASDPDDYDPRDEDDIPTDNEGDPMDITGD